LLARPGWREVAQALDDPGGWARLLYRVARPLGFGSTKGAVFDFVFSEFSFHSSTGHGITVIPCAIPFRCAEEQEPSAEPEAVKNTRLKKKPVSAETIARMADNGKDVSRFFTNTGEMRKPIQRVNVDFTASMLEELENAARDLNISRQAVIKTLIRQGLDQRQRTRASRSRAKRA
jgi:hypothetical protein